MHFVAAFLLLTRVVVVVDPFIVAAIALTC